MVTRSPERPAWRRGLWRLLVLSLGLQAPSALAADLQLSCGDINHQGLHQYQSIIRQAERRHGVNAALIAAVIQAESAFNARAISRAGAQGLMQLMPNTARELRVINVHDPTQNVDGGTRYLKQQILHFGDVGKGLWAYNAGPERVKSKRLFTETRRYIPRVLFYYECLRPKGERP